MISRREVLTRVTAFGSAMLLLPRVAACRAHLDERGGFLDLAAARSIVYGNSPFVDRIDVDEIWLDLSTFSDYAQSAIDFLAAHIGPLDGVIVGFHRLTCEGAIALSQLRTEFIHLISLHQLEADVASNLRWKPEEHPITTITLKEPLSSAAADVLACDLQGCQLHISVPSVGPSVARALSRHDHELFLDIREDQPCTAAAEALTMHAGYLLWLTLPSEPSSVLIRSLSSSATKTCCLRKNKRHVWIDNKEPLS